MIADDLTGATDVAAAFANAGFSSTVVLDTARAPKLASRVLVLSSNSRQSTPAAARRKVRAACGWLQARGAKLIYKKMDSTLHGNVLAEVLALREEARFDAVLLCPANPSQGRVVSGGRLVVRGVDRGSLRERLGASGDTVSVSVPFRRTHLERLLAGADLVLADATSQRQLDTLVEVGTQPRRRVLLAGSAGLAAALARRLAQERRAQPPRRRGRTGLPGLRAQLPLLIFSGSSSAVTQQQIEALRRQGKTSVLALNRDAGGGARQALATGRTVVVLVPIYRRSDREIRRNLEQFNPLLRGEGARLGGMLLVGGDTALFICRWLRPRALAVEGDILPGLAWGRWLGGLADGINVGTKPGGFGTEDALVQLRRVLARAGHPVVPTRPERTFPPP